MEIDLLDNETLDEFAIRVGRSVEQLSGDNPDLGGALADKEREAKVKLDPKGEGFAALEVALEEVELGDKETLSDFEKRVPGCSRAQLRLFNEELDTGLRGVMKGWFERSPAGRGIATLSVQAHIEVEELAGPPLPAADEPLLGLENADRLWLSYESLFNQRPYRKTNQACKMGLYQLPVSRLRIFLREEVDAEVCAALVDAFFPDLSVDRIEGLSAVEWKWKVRKPVAGLSSPTKLVSNRETNVVYTESYAILPYNYIDNSVDSHAIGTKERTEWGAELVQIEPTWNFWKTASRSCIVQLARVKDKGRPWEELLVKEPFAWSYPETTKVEGKAVGASERGVDLAAEATENTAFALDKVEGAFSVKTGVVWVGIRNQQGAHKDKLEENCIVACLRSDLIVERDKAAERDPKKDLDLIVQTELLSLTERNLLDGEAFGDGVQVRDLSVLDSSKLYIPPISIPFLDLGMKRLQRRFECVNDKNWRDFWCEAYAKSIGRAKAMLLFRYGLQMGSPNAQNWLLEFEPGDEPKFTGRVVVRDVGDAYLHREVIWARYGGKGLPPQEPDDRKRLAELTSAIIEYECAELAAKWDYYPQETGSMYEQQYGPPGTRFLWQRFSTLSKGSSVAVPSPMGTDPDAFTEGWQRVLATMAEWGLAHNKAYTAHLQEVLEVDFEIEWDKAPKPDRYLELKDRDQAGADRLYKEDLDWEDGKEAGASVKIHNFLASEKGQEAIKRRG